MTGKQTFRNDDDAVSPVIGVILMVAITVILAAVIGTFVLNLGGSVQQNVQASASVTATNSNEVKVTWTDNQNANDLQVSISDCGTDSTTLSKVGDTFTSSTSCSSGSTATVVVTAIGDGDAKTVVINKDVNF